MGRTARRSTPSFYLLTELRSVLRGSRNRIAEAVCPYFLPMVRLAIRGYDRGGVDAAELRAVLKVHRLRRPGRHLSLPRLLGNRADRLVTAAAGERKPRPTIDESGVSRPAVLDRNAHVPWRIRSRPERRAEPGGRSPSPPEPRQSLDVPEERRRG